MLVMGEAVHLWGLGVLGTLCTFPLSFAVNFKLLLKSLNLKKKNWKDMIEVIKTNRAVDAVT